MAKDGKLTTNKPRLVNIKQIDCLFCGKKIGDFKMEGILYASMNVGHRAVMEGIAKYEEYNNGKNYLVKADCPHCENINILTRGKGEQVKGVGNMFSKCRKPRKPKK